MNKRRRYKAKRRRADRRGLAWPKGFYKLGEATVEDYRKMFPGVSESSLQLAVYIDNQIAARMRRVFL